MTENKEREILAQSDSTGIANLQEAMNEIEVVDPEVVSSEDKPIELGFKGLPTNIPYKKIFNENGDLANPITKADPYRMPFMNRRDKKALIRKATKQPKNNKKGIRLVVTPFAKGQFVKTEVVRQRIEKGYEPAMLGDNGLIVAGSKTYKARTVIHNQIQL